MPVENFEIETIFDHNDPRLTEFRKQIYIQDLGLDHRCMSLNRTQLKNYTDHKTLEDAWKYCNEKWNRVGFDSIEAIIEDGKVVGMSGCRLYGEYLRTSMHLYLLKSVRKKYPGIKYLKGGWFERHLDYSKNHCINIKGLFFTVYAYSRKLQGLIDNHRSRRISLIDKEYLLYIDDMVEVGEYMFNNVPQTFFYYRVSDTFDPEGIVD
jgi:hypothetical protein